MKERYIDIDGHWGVILIYGFDEADAARLAAIMDSFGMDDGKIDYSLSVLYGLNSGMTISREDLTMSVIFLGDATSQEQFFDTLAHEIDHVQYAINHFYDIAEGGEDAAWLQGYIMRRATRWLFKDGYICG